MERVENGALRFKRDARVNTKNVPRTFARIHQPSTGNFNSVKLHTKMLVKSRWKARIVHRPHGLYAVLRVHHKGSLPLFDAFQQRTRLVNSWNGESATTAMFSIFMKLVAIAHARIASPPAETSLMCQYASSQTDVRSLNKAVELVLTTSYHYLRHDYGNFFEGNTMGMVLPLVSGRYLIQSIIRKMCYQSMWSF